MDMGNPTGRIMNNIKIGIMLFVFFGSASSYLIIWTRIKSSLNCIPNTHRKRKYTRSARVMLLIVLSYLLQWWPLVVLAVWIYLGGSPIPRIMILVVLFCNLGGVFNGFAYTLMRRNYLKMTPVSNKVPPNDESRVSLKQKSAT